MSKLSRVLFMALGIISFSCSLYATEIIYDKELPGLGVNTIPFSASTWKSKTMRYPVPTAESDIIQVGPEFFEAEYGKSCVFNTDWIKNYGFCGDGSYEIKDGSMAVKTGANGFYFGFGKLNESSNQKGIRFGAAWGPYPEAGLYLEMEVEPSEKTTEWEFSTTGLEKKFEIGTSGKIRLELANFNWLSRENNPWIMFKCLTPDTSVKVKSIRLFPTGAYVSYKRTFMLEAKPVIARASFSSCPTYKLYINGILADSGNNIYPSAFLRHIDIAPYLKQGANEIIFTKQFINWSLKRTDWLFEGCAVDEKGNLTRIAGDENWECTLNPDAKGGWKKPDLLDGLQYITNTPMINGESVFTGLNPQHMGILSVSPFNRKFPVFDPGEPVVLNAAIPAGLKGKYSVKASVYFHDGPPALVAENIGPASSVVAKGLANLKFQFANQKVGPYLVKWSVFDQKGEKVEEAETEFVIVGPIVQDEYELKSFETELEKRLELVQKIDCSKEVEIGDEFLGYTGMYNKPAYNPGQVVSKDGMKYRETGTGAFLYYAYRLHLKELGEPYLVEVVIPDNGERQIYTGVAEQYPLWFENNAVSLTDIQTRSPVTGSSVTGGSYPLSYKPKKIRYIYYPNSLTAAVTVINGCGGDNAAAIEINIYRVRNGLPALKIPASTRLFGSHEERALTPESMAAENVLEKSDSIRNEPHLYQWRNWYKMTERKIKWLRFQGRNMTSEGAYMYTAGEFPTEKHSPYFASKDEDNLLYLALRMYQQNKIKCLLSVEYMASPWIGAGGIDDGLSDRKMAEGEKESLFLVDRYGNQITKSDRTGMNFLHPQMKDIFLDVFRELYGHYKDIDCIEGILMPTGVWWAPGFISAGNWNLVTTDVGYGDLTVGLFEKETGIKLGVPSNDPERFSKRYDILMGEHQKAWLDWREQKLSACFKQVSDTICTAKNKWKLYVYPGFNNIGKGSPFSERSATMAERNDYLDEVLRENALDRDLAKKNNMISFIFSTIDPLPFLAYRDPKIKLAASGWNSNPSNLNFIKNNAGFFNQYGLDEIDIPATEVKRWLWSRGQRNAYVPRPVGEICMKPFVDIIKNYTPKIIFYSWLDCNMETAHGEQIRRFCKALYETPDLEFQELSPADARGIYAQAAKDAKGVKYLRLVNNAPYPASGFIRFDGGAYDCVYDEALEKKAGGFLLSLLPSDIRIIKLTGGKGSVKCDFAFADSVQKDISGKAQAVLSSKMLSEKIPKSYLVQLTDAVTINDAFLMYAVLEEYEVKRCLEMYSFKSLELQGKLLADLKKNGKCFINCAAKDEYIDPSGNRWLPDQTYNEVAYGNEYANFANRGDLPIEGTDQDRVYQTEAYGEQVYYYVPLPNGKYNVYIHTAETWLPNKEKGRLFSVIIGNIRREDINPVARSGGFARAWVEKIEGVNVTDGLLSIEFKGGVGVNGIEIERQ